MKIVKENILLICIFPICTQMRNVRSLLSIFFANWRRHWHKVLNTPGVTPYPFSVHRCFALHIARLGPLESGVQPPSCTAHPNRRLLWLCCCVQPTRAARSLYHTQRSQLDRKVKPYAASTTKEREGVITFE